MSCKEAKREPIVYRALTLLRERDSLLARALRVSRRAGDFLTNIVNPRGLCLERCGPIDRIFSCVLSKAQHLACVSFFQPEFRTYPGPKLKKKKPLFFWGRSGGIENASYSGVLSASFGEPALSEGSSVSGEASRARTWRTLPQPDGLGNTRSAAPRTQRFRDGALSVRWVGPSGDAAIQNPIRDGSWGHGGPTPVWIYVPWAMVPGVGSPRGRTDADDVSGDRLPGKAPSHPSIDHEASRVNDGDAYCRIAAVEGSTFAPEGRRGGLGDNGAFVSQHFSAGTPFGPALRKRAPPRHLRRTIVLLGSPPVDHRLVSGARPVPTTTCYSEATGNYP